MKAAGALLAVLLLAAPQGQPARSEKATTPHGLRLAALMEADSLADPQRLLNYANGGDPAVQGVAIRALGNRRDRSLTRLLLPFLQASDERVRDEAVGAVVQSLKGEPLPGDPELVPAVERLLMSAASPMASWALGHLPYTTAEEVKTAERFLADGGHPPLADGLEALARRNPKLVSFDPETIDRLAASDDCSIWLVTKSGDDEKSCNDEDAAVFKLWRAAYGERSRERSRRGSAPTK